MNDAHFPPQPIRPNANLWEQIVYLVKAARFLVAEALNSRFRQEKIMANLTDLLQAVEDFKAAVARHATKIETELAQLLAAQGASDQPAIDAAAQSIRDQTAALAALDVSLDADDPATP